MTASVGWAASVSCEGLALVVTQPGEIVVAKHNGRQEDMRNWPIYIQSFPILPAEVCAS